MCLTSIIKTHLSRYFPSVNSLIVLYLLLWSWEGTSQRKDFSSALTTGISVPLLDSGAGALLGFQASHSFHPHISTDGMISYNYNRIFSSFLSGEKGHTHTLLILAGGRIYLLPAERKTQCYLQLMASSQIYQERTTNRDHNTKWGLGYSVGLFGEWKRFLIGITTQSPLHLGLLTGIKF